MRFFGMWYIWFPLPSPLVWPNKAQARHFWAVWVSKSDTPSSWLTCSVKTTELFASTFPWSFLTSTSLSYASQERHLFEDWLDLAIAPWLRPTNSHNGAREQAKVGLKSNIDNVWFKQPILPPIDNISISADPRLDFINCQKDSLAKSGGCVPSVVLASLASRAPYSDRKSSDFFAKTFTFSKLAFEALLSKCSSIYNKT